ncbi:MAG TPA: NAD(P)H-dependent oxidoreductase [Rhodocyclaceae bacterium]|nr:NAD(P)H-dependent oxidoreductase [Rhodocyclaceae bacterium]
MSKTLKFLGISGSLRKASCNTGLLRAAQASLPADTSLDIADLSDIPFYNADIKEKPASVLRVLARRLCFCLPGIQLVARPGAEEHHRLGLA